MDKIYKTLKFRALKKIDEESNYFELLKIQINKDQKLQFIVKNSFLDGKLLENLILEVFLSNIYN